MPGAQGLPRRPLLTPAELRVVEAHERLGVEAEKVPGEPRRIVRVAAGAFILISLALGIPGSPVFHSPWWLAFTAFVGANLFQYGLTNVCPMGWMLRKLGVPDTCAVRA